ncbi:hypothetical protein H8958_004223 [Nasalis larvatus]
MLKNLVKVALKLGLLLRGDQLGREELALLWHFRNQAHFLAMMAISFQQVDFTFDQQVLAVGLLECHDLLHQAVGPQLTAKSHSCINHVFSHLANCDFLAVLYGPQSPTAPTCAGSNLQRDIQERNEAYSVKGNILRYKLERSLLRNFFVRYTIPFTDQFGNTDIRESEKEYFGSHRIL